MVANFIPRRIAFAAFFTIGSILFITGMISHSHKTMKKQREINLPKSQFLVSKFEAYLDKQLDELAAEMIASPVVATTTLPPFSSTSLGKNTKENNLGCDDLISLLGKSEVKRSSTFRRENKDGNRGIYFSDIDDENAENHPIVIKVATIRNTSDVIEQYRYNSALREIRNLRRLREVHFDGAPRIWGSCVQPWRVIYAVTRFTDSQPLCTGNGTDMSCALAQNVIETMSRMKDAKRESLKFLEKVTCFFAQYERHRLFMEDFSGANFHFSPSTWDLYLVDADSVIFYEDAPILSRMSCHTNADCPKPSGNLWPAHALNRKIYFGCEEMYGVCTNNSCHGIGSSLHTCGVGRWLITAMRSIVPVEVYTDYRNMKECTSESNPQKRCSMINACENARSVVDKYERRTRT